MLWRHRRDERREHTLGEAHMQPPEANGNEEHDKRPPETEQEIGHDQGDEPEDQEWARSDLVLQKPRRISAYRIGEVHRRDYRRRPGDCEAALLRADDEKRLAEARHRKHRPRG